MASTRRAFMQMLGAAVVGLTIALPTRTFGRDDEIEWEPHYYSGEPILRAGGAMDALVLRSMEKRAARDMALGY